MVGFADNINSSEYGIVFRHRDRLLFAKMMNDDFDIPCRIEDHENKYPEMNEKCVSVVKMEEIFRNGEEGVLLTDLFSFVLCNLLQSQDSVLDAFQNKHLRQTVLRIIKQRIKEKNY